MAQQLFGLVFSLVLLLIVQIVVFMRYVKSRCMYYTYYLSTSPWLIYTCTAHGDESSPLLGVADGDARRGLQLVYDSHAETFTHRHICIELS